MALTTGSVTIHGASTSAVIQITNDTLGLALASGFQSLTAGALFSSSAAYSPSTAAFAASENGLTGGVVVSGSTSTVLGGDNSPLFFIGSSNAEIVAGNANDVIVAQTGADTIAAGGGNNLIDLGTGTSTVFSDGNDTILSGTGGAVVFAGTSDQSSITGTGSMTVYAASGGLNYVQQGSVGATFISNASGVAINVTGGSGAETLYGASGATLTVSNSTSNNVFVANDSTHGGVSGSVVMNGSSATGGSQFWAGSGNATLIGGVGNDTLVAGFGSATMTGAGGSNEFDFFTVQGGSNTQVTITDFNASDTLKLFGYGTSAAAVAFSSAATVGSSPVITLSDQTSITLSGFSKTQLTQNEIISTAPTTTTT